MLRICLFCSMCAKEAEIDIDKRKITADTKLSDLIKKARWTGQQNGSNYDLYCSKECAT